MVISQRAQECIRRDELEVCATADLVDDEILTDDAVEEICRPDRDYTTLQGWRLYFEQTPHSARFLQIAGKPYDGGPMTTFDTGYSLLETDVGILARADEGQDVARIVGTADRVRDPISQQFRPLVCVYNYADACSLRIVSLGDGDNPLAIKLQVVLFDDYGFVEKKLDFPATN